MFKNKYLSFEIEDKPTQYMLMGHYQGYVEWHYTTSFKHRVVKGTSSIDVEGTSKHEL